MAARTSAPVRFEAPVEVVGARRIALLPAEASAALPSRGQVAVTGTVDGAAFTAVVEPDGLRGHWLDVDRLAAASGTALGDTVTVEFAPAEEWPEPEVPADLRAALDEAIAADAPSGAAWSDITPMARWEWVRWVQATRDEATRARRVEVSISKLDNGSRRPCCFDLSSCTDPELAKSGKLPQAK